MASIQRSEALPPLSPHPYPTSTSPEFLPVATSRQGACDPLLHSLARIADLPPLRRTAAREDDLGFQRVFQRLFLRAALCWRPCRITMFGDQFPAGSGIAFQ